MRHSLFAAATIGVTCLLAVVVPVHAAEIKVLSGNGARGAVAELCAQFERASGHTVTLRFEVNPQVQGKIEEGEDFDVAILNPPVLDDLIRQGRIVAGTRAVIGRSGIGVAVREGAPKEPEAARALLRFLTASSAAPVLQAAGIEPFKE